jgi:catechol 2,3-dioxygenase-like lactoylglutathione lyase family enzyme
MLICRSGGRETQHDVLFAAGGAGYGGSVIRALHHVQLAMPPRREVEAEAFYAGVLGVPRVAKPPHLERRGGCWFRSDGVEIHLGVEQPFTPARKAHPAFLVDDLAGLRERLTAAGAPVVLDEPLPGYDRFYTSDPFGNRIEVLSPQE